MMQRPISLVWNVRVARAIAVVVWSAASHNPKSGLSARLLQTDHTVLLQPLQAPIHFNVWRRFDDLVEYGREFHRPA